MLVQPAWFGHLRVRERNLIGSVDKRTVGSTQQDVGVIWGGGLLSARSAWFIERQVADFLFAMIEREARRAVQQGLQLMPPTISLQSSITPRPT